MIHPKDKIKFAQLLRQKQTDTEHLLWSKLRNRQLLGLKFRRQEPIGKYIVDFVNIEKMLIIELDGSQHQRSNAISNDIQRTKWLESQGYKVLRFWDNEILYDINSVLDQIALTLTPCTIRYRTLLSQREREN